MELKKINYSYFNLFILLFCLLFFYNCASNKEIRIGFLGPFTGWHASLGIAGRNGAMVAVEEINSRGGIAGSMVKLIFEDDRQDSSIAAKSLEYLVTKEHVAAIIGPMISSVAADIQPLLSKYNTVLVSPTVSSVLLNDIDDNFIRLYPSIRDMASRLAEFISSDISVRNVSIIYDSSNEAHSAGWIKFFMERFSTSVGSRIKIYKFNSKKNISYTSIADDLISSSAQAVLIIANGNDTAMICQHIRKKNSSMKFFATEWSSTDDLIINGGRSVEGLMFFQTFDRNEKTEKYLKFKKLYTDRFKSDPTFASVHSYECMMLIADALEKNLNNGNLKNRIISIGRFSGLQSEILINIYGDVQRKYFLMKVKNGTFVRV